MSWGEWLCLAWLLLQGRPLHFTRAAEVWSCQTGKDKLLLVKVEKLLLVGVEKTLLPERGHFIRIYVFNASSFIRVFLYVFIPTHSFSLSSNQCPHFNTKHTARFTVQFALCPWDSVFDFQPSQSCGYRLLGPPSGQRERLSGYWCGAWVVAPLDISTNSAQRFWFLYIFANAYYLLFFFNFL